MLLQPEEEHLVDLTDLLAFDCASLQQVAAAGLLILKGVALYWRLRGQNVFFICSVFLIARNSRRLVVCDLYTCC